MRKIFLLIITVSFIASSLFASDGSDKRIKFKKGESSATVTGGISRGETISYVLTAKINQNMKVTITSPEKNAVFNIKDLKTGLYLEYATEFDDAHQWEGVLPSSGDYRITVGSERGGAEYKMVITIY